MTTREKIAALRALMRQEQIDAYYVPSVDPHQSEYVPACWQRRDACLLYTSPSPRD